MSDRRDHPSADVLMLYLAGELQPDDRGTVHAHLDACHQCATLLRELADMDGLLRALPEEPVPAGFVDRVRARLLLAARDGRSWGRWAAAAALFVALGGLAGWTAARSVAPAPIVRNGEGPKFALVFAEDPETWNALPAAERSRRYDEFMAWLRSIGDGSVRLGGTQLDAQRGRIVGASLPTTDPRLVLSGFIVIRASSYDEAQGHAERCPIVTRGGQVIVRQLRN